MYTPEQLERRNNSKWTVVQGILAPIQFLAFVVSSILVIRYLTTGEGYEIATISALIKIALLWLITITGMIWEKEVFGQWFLAPQFFWEDVLNAIAMILHNLYFVGRALGWSDRTLMIVLLIAFVSYLGNFAQFFMRGLQARRERLERQQLTAATVGERVS
jgi:3-vinyl bacteriochlorophyllide hydratase